MSPQRDGGGPTYFDPEQYGKRRDDSNGLLSRFAAWGMKYNWVITVLFALFLLMGFGFKTPRDAFSEIETAINEVKATAEVNKRIAASGVDTLRERLNDSERDFRTLKTLLEASVIAQCKSLSKGATQYLPCRRLYREWGIE